LFNHSVDRYSNEGLEEFRDLIEPKKSNTSSTSKSQENFKNDDNIFKNGGFNDTEINIDLDLNSDLKLD
jgi:hypothetical protein